MVVSFVDVCSLPLKFQIFALTNGAHELMWMLSFDDLTAAYASIYRKIKYWLRSQLI